MKSKVSPSASTWKLGWTVWRAPCRLMGRPKELNARTGEGFAFHSQLQLQFWDIIIPIRLKAAFALILLSVCSLLRDFSFFISEKF